MNNQYDHWFEEKCVARPREMTPIEKAIQHSDFVLIPCLGEDPTIPPPPQTRIDIVVKPYTCRNLFECYDVADAREEGVFSYGESLAYLEAKLFRIAETHGYRKRTLYLNALATLQGDIERNVLG